MTDAILIFTFSPIQSFIGEARRAADLYAGSKILSRLANAAASAMQCKRCTLIYPANPNPEDMPNKLMARVPFGEAEAIADRAKEALLKEWQDTAKEARKKLAGYEPKPDETWKTIWERQRDHFWEIYWVAQEINGDYKTAFKLASDALDAVKRTRAFDAVEEDGLKDSLSGKRSALRTREFDAKEYWKRVKPENPSLLRSEGKERLDTLGAVKRFCNIADAENFASVSMVATKEYVTKATSALAFPPFRKAVEQLLDNKIYRVRNDAQWPYDGDLFFAETYQANRLKNSYDVNKPDVSRLQQVQRALKALHDEVGKPSPYYAILQLDGDSMGEKISECDQDQHSAFSKTLANFAKEVRGIVERRHGELIYNGGDDVLALASLSQALPLAQELATVFRETVKHPTDSQKTCTMSAGIAIAHHLYPLDAALSAARNAEHRAKEVEGKNAVCVRVLKRSGETFDARSPWKVVDQVFDDGKRVFDEIVKLFDDEGTGASALSSRFAYDVARSAYALPDADERLQSELKRLLKRHRNSKHPNAPDVENWAEKLKTWARELPDHAEELGKWLVLARFVAQGGGE